MKKINKKKIILSIGSITLLMGIVASSIYFQKDTNNLYNNLSESIITKQPNLNTILGNKTQEVEIQLEENKEEVQNIQEEKETNSNNNTKQTNNKTSNISTKKTSNVNTKKTSNTNAKKTSNKTSNENSKSSNNNTSNKTNKTTVTGNFNQTEAKKLLGLVNKVRKENGLKEVSWNSSLENSAKIRAKETSTKFAHTRPNGSRYNTAINTKYKTSGENIAAGQSSATEVFNSWMNSEGHKKNILSPNFTQIAVAVYYNENSTYQYYWSQLFIG